MFREMGVNFVETQEPSKEGAEPGEEGEASREEADEEAGSESGELVEVQQKVPAKPEAKEPTERTDDSLALRRRPRGTAKIPC
jgi:RNA polymerase primary sigma factor